MTTARAPSLRRRLVAGLVAVLALGVVTFAAVTYISLGAFLEHRTEGDSLALSRASAGIVREVLGPQAGRPTSVQRELTLLKRLRAVTPVGDAVLLRMPNDGLYIQPAFPPGPVSVGSTPVIRALNQLSLPDIDTTSQPTRAAPIPLGNYLVADFYFPRSDASVLAAVSTGGDRATLHRLLLIEVVSAFWLFVLLAAISLVVVRRGLRPLDTIAATALAIAGGERGLSIPVAEGRSEVGRVTAALNRMIRDNEAALQAKEDSEAQLRRFVADASHELRTPLASIRSYADLLASGAAQGAEGRLALERIQRESVRMTRLVEDLLLLARLDTGRPLSRSPVNLTELAADAVADAQALEPDRPVRLLATRRVSVPGDADRLAQVLTNLLANARVHTPAGAPVEVSVEVRGRWAELAVRDHGPGVPAADAGRVFDRFYRLDPSRHRSAGQGGMGLGLAIVAGVVHAHGGRVRVENPAGGGARFVVSLPGVFVVEETEQLTGSGAPT